ncbi:unnamed protein product [Arabidopsis halleri]
MLSANSIIFLPVVNFFFLRFDYFEFWFSFFCCLFFL